MVKREMQDLYWVDNRYLIADDVFEILIVVNKMYRIVDNLCFTVYAHSGNFHYIKQSSMMNISIWLLKVEI